MGGRVEEDMIYYKGKLLELIVNNPHKYGLWEIQNIFGLSREKIEEFIMEYNKMGFEIDIKKGKYFIKRPNESLEAYKEAVKDLEKLFEIVKKLRLENQTNKKITREKFIKYICNPKGIPPEKALSLLERDGIVFCKGSYINLLEPPFEDMEDKKLLKLLIFMNVVKNLYPKRNLLNSIFKKLLSEYEGRGLSFNQEAVKYECKSKMYLYDELILNAVEDAIYYDKSLEFSYRTQVGVRNIRINPSGIIYNSQKDIWYVVTNREQKTEYRMDKMTEVRIVEGGVGHFERNLYEHSMGISGESLIDVKAAFKKEDYIYKKLLSYMKLRKSAVISETSNAYILTDRVCGTNEFKKWLRAFGENAICLKPEKLREELIRDVKLLRERYEVV